ncbi:MAG TPA: Rid family detoxifying hydrolase [Terriglobia bacterium]|nr:Rid family detoxifying hydrolase [Terriglobia bacterium]
MAKVEIKHPDKKVSTGAYSAAVLIDGWVYVSGQGPLDMKTGELVEGTIEDQTRLTLTHIGKILKAAGCSFDNAVKSTCHLSDIRDFGRFNAVYAEFFPGVRPARTTVQSGLGKGMRVEIDVVARVPK